MKVVHESGWRTSRNDRRRAFTLVELLIVIVTMATIAGMVIPQFESAMNDAKRSAALENLHSLTVAIERYKLHHFGEPPDDLTGQSLPQLVSTTNEFGQIGDGPEYRFGPYILGEIPVNPLTNSAEVVETTVVPPTNLSAQVGWIYDPQSGQIWAAEGQLYGKIKSLD